MNTIPAVMSLKEMEELRIYLALKEAEEEAAATDHWLSHAEIMASAKETLRVLREGGDDLSAQVPEILPHVAA